MQLIKVKLTTLPESIGNLTKLTYIVLYDNQLTTLTESIWNLTNLMSEYFKFLPSFNLNYILFNLSIKFFYWFNFCKIFLF